MSPVGILFCRRRDELSRLWTDKIRPPWVSTNQPVANNAIAGVTKPLLQLLRDRDKVHALQVLFLRDVGHGFQSFWRSCSREGLSLRKTGQKWMARVITLLALVVMGWVSEARACVVCIPYPTVTHADILLTSDVVVMARENPEKPFSYSVTDVLKGVVDGEPSGVFVDSRTRRLLGLNPRDRVVLYRKTTGSQWRRLTYADVEYQGIVAAILQRSNAWGPDSRSPKRIAYFSQLLNNSQPTIGNQAYLEVGRAPYYQIKQVADLVPRAKVLQFLSDWRRIEWRRLYILMLANSGHTDDQALIRDKFIEVSKFGFTTNLSAWTVAFIEIDLEKAIQELEALYFRNERRSDEELAAVMQAISVIAGQDGGLPPTHRTKLRRRAIQGFETLLDRHPQMAGYVAKALTVWKQKALENRLADIASRKLVRDPGAAFAVDHYLSMAQRFPPVLKIH